MRRKGREKGSTAASGSQSWRELAGPRRTKILSRQASQRRRARILKRLGLFSLFAALLGGSIWGVIELSNRETDLALKTPSKPIERIIFETNGVLPDTWLGQIADLRPGMTMMEADIFGLKARLEAHGQVKSATVERMFPADLKVVVKERVPVLRLAVTNATGARELRIVGDDGAVYEGIGYAKATLQNLPYVLPYQHSNGSYLPMLGIDRVAQLLDTARQLHPELAKSWQVVSLKYYSGDLDIPGQIIEVRSKMVPRILFSASNDFEVQLERLDYVLDYVAARGNPSLERIDLSLRGSAAVQFTSGRISTY